MESRRHARSVRHRSSPLASTYGLALTSGNLVLEIRTHDVPFLLEHGQPLFRIEFVRNEAAPSTLYGPGPNYQMHGLKLAKQFG